MKVVLLFAFVALSLHQCIAADSASVVYSKDTFEEAKGKQPLFVKFYAPWCGHCKRLAPTWEELAEKYNVDGQKVVIGKVDCTVETSLCSDNGVTGYPTLKFFNAEGEAEKYKGGRDLDALSKFVVDKLGGGPIPSAAGSAGAENGLYILNNDNFDGHIAQGAHFIKFYAPWCGHCKRLAPTWDELAKKYEKDSSVKIGKVDCTVDKEVCQKFEVRGYPTLLFIKDGKMEEKYGGARDMSSFESFLSKKSGKKAPAAAKEEAGETAEGLIQLTAGSAKDVLAKDATTFVKFFAPWCGHCKRMAEEYVKLAAKYKNAKGIQIAEMDCTAGDNRPVCSDYGVKGFPTLKLFRSGEEIAQHRGGRDMATMDAFIAENALEGQADGAGAGDAKKEAPKADAEPAKADESGLMVLNDGNFDSIAQTTKTSFVKFYAPWCGHCKRMAPDYVKLAEEFKDNDNVVIAKIDCTENQKTCGRFGVRGYPTLKLIREGKEITEYNGQRTVDGMKSFVEENAKDEKQMEAERDEL